VIVFLYKSPVAQLSILVTMAALLFIWTLAIRPFSSLFHLIFEVITQLLLIIALAGLLASAVYAKRGCYQCGGREGFLCYLILICLFLFLVLLALGLLVFSLLGRCCGTKAYGQENEFTSNSQNVSMQIPPNQESYEQNQDQFRVQTLFNNNQGLEGQNINSNLGQTKNISSNLFVNNNLISQTHDISKNVDVKVKPKNDNAMISDDSLSNISISPPSMKNINTDFSSNSEYSHHYKNQQMYSSRFNNGRNLYSRRDNRNTNTVRVDSDDEIHKQNEIIEALSMSQISYSDMERDDFNSIRKSVENDKKEFLKRQYYYDQGYSTDDQHRFEDNIARRGWANRNQYSTSSKFTSDWGHSQKN
jgi:uncharacterized membrane protein YhaH (DUF805 family)